MKYVVFCGFFVFFSTWKKHCLYNRLFVLLANFFYSLLCCRHVLPKAFCLQSDENILQ